MIELDTYDTIRAVVFTGAALRLLDQRRLPFEELHLDCRNADEVAGAIRDLVVRGAPDIGIAAAWGIVLQAQIIARAGQEGFSAGAGTGLPPSQCRTTDGGESGLGAPDACAKR